MPLVEFGRREDLRPVAAGPSPGRRPVQGIYAHLGIVRFWEAQRQVAADPDELLRAQVHFVRWGQALDLAIRTLLGTGCLTPEGVRFAELLQARAGN